MEKAVTFTAAGCSLSFERTQGVVVAGWTGSLGLYGASKVGTVLHIRVVPSVTVMLARSHSAHPKFTTFTPLQDTSKGRCQNFLSVTTNKPQRMTNIGD